jgi:HNH endonuclease
MKYHRYLTERRLGRRLLPTEIVHHKDGDTLNNSIDNLEIMTRAAHVVHHHAIVTKHTCQWCGKTFARTSRRPRKFCSHSCTAKYVVSVKPINSRIYLKKRGRPKKSV